MHHVSDRHWEYDSLVKLIQSALEGLMWGAALGPRMFHVLSCLLLHGRSAALLRPGRVRDYGESPVKRARLALEGFTWGRPSIPTAADLAGVDEVMVAAESVMSQKAADLAPGTTVEYRSREPYLIGGWFRARVLQASAE